MAMMASSQGPRQVAIVTGSGQGIGLGIARALIGSGMRVVLADIDVESAGKSAEELGPDALALELDVSKSAAWTAVIETIQGQFGRLDVLVNNAGISPRGTPETTDEALWDRTMGINLKGAWLGIKTALPLLKSARGTVINIGSTRATRPLPGLFAYGTSKAGLLGLTRQVAVEYLSEGVTCNMVAPGWVDTPGERILQRSHGIANFPDGVQNLVTIDEVGAAVAYLVSPQARKVNGIILYLDAGLHCADDAGMVYLPDVAHGRYTQRGIE
jgi:NAD(P)-dependent dehydrogenase (short-subunit alcohol dehydrogenase family)